MGDAEALPYEDASFDVVVSAVGVMFAPDQERAAAELARVCRPGGRLGLTAWNPEGGANDLFAVMQPFMPPPPPGLPSPFDWGRPSHARGLLGDAFDLEFEELDSPFELESGEAAWELFSTSFGPIKTLADSLPPDRLAELRAAFIASHEEGAEDNVSSREYVLVRGARR